MTEVLANPIAARNHARSMADTYVEVMPIPSPVADDLPSGGDRPIDYRGACATLLLFNADMPSGSMSPTL